MLLDIIELLFGFKTRRRLHRLQQALFPRGLTIWVLLVLLAPELHTA